jgi:hypothetical protein
MQMPGYLRLGRPLIIKVLVLAYWPLMRVALRRADDATITDTPTGFSWLHRIPVQRPAIPSDRHQSRYRHGRGSMIRSPSSDARSDACPGYAASAGPTHATLACGASACMPSDQKVQP